MKHELKIHFIRDDVARSSCNQRKRWNMRLTDNIGKVTCKTCIELYRYKLGMVKNYKLCGSLYNNNLNKTTP